MNFLYLWAGARTVRGLYAGWWRHQPATQEGHESQAAASSLLLPSAPALLRRFDHRRHGRLPLFVAGWKDLRLRLMPALLYSKHTASPSSGIESNLPFSRSHFRRLMTTTCYRRCASALCGKLGGGRVNNAFSVKSIYIRNRAGKQFTKAAPFWLTWPWLKRHAFIWDVQRGSFLCGFRSPSRVELLENARNRHNNESHFGPVQRGQQSGNGCKEPSFVSTRCAGRREKVARSEMAAHQWLGKENGQRSVRGS